jgi:hypothetical protein
LDVDRYIRPAILLFEKNIKGKKKGEKPLD